MSVPDLRRLLPRTDLVLAEPVLAGALEALGRERVRREVVAVLDGVRTDPPDRPLSPGAAAGLVAARLPAAPTGLHPVLNATGVVVHTNLGRAPLSDAARDAVAVAAGYVDVEFDLADGRRARRGRDTLAALRRAVPEAGDVHVVNNGAAALALVMATMATADPGREVVVSRGEMVEIGDGFRLPDLITSTGAVLREVGTTNRVRAGDYAEAIGPRTAAVLKVHPSNFRVDGFTSAVPVRELARLGVPVIADVGSGLLTADPLLPLEPDVTSALRAGATVVTCSGDKLLGGPQAGLLFGPVELIDRMRRHPLARALRVDKLTLAALEATLDGPVPPVTAFRRADPDRLRRRCEALAAALATDGAFPVEVVPSTGVIGGGGAPGVELPGWAVALPSGCAARLRRGRPAVVARVERGRCLVDLRCIPESADEAVLAAVRAALGDPGPDTPDTPDSRDAPDSPDTLDRR